MNNTKKNVLTTGCFDLLHIGHIIFLIHVREEAAKYLGVTNKDINLIVGYTSQRILEKTKPKDKYSTDEETRKRELLSIGLIDEAISQNGIAEIATEMTKLEDKGTKIDLFVFGQDQIGEKFDSAIIKIKERTTENREPIRLEMRSEDFLCNFPSSTKIYEYINKLKNKDAGVEKARKEALKKSLLKLENVNLIAKMIEVGILKDPNNNFMTSSKISSVVNKFGLTLRSDNQKQPETTVQREDLRSPISTSSPATVNYNQVLFLDVSVTAEEAQKAAKKKGIPCTISTGTSDCGDPIDIPSTPETSNREYKGISETTKLDDYSFAKSIKDGQSKSENCR